MDSTKLAEPPQKTPVKTVPLTKLSVPLAVSPALKPSKPAIAIPKPSRKILAAKKLLIATPQVPVSQKPPPLRPSPASTPSPVPTPTPSPDVFQVEGAIACDGIDDCYASSETNGRQVSQTLEKQLKAQGYRFEPLDLNDDTAMKVYRLSQNNQPRGYLHIIWTEQGTRSLRLPEAVRDWQQLMTVAQLSPETMQN
ncbi:MAG: hypothetical protein RBJ76_02680 [Stenomitos frigidus ULC029]